MGLLYNFNLFLPTNCLVVAEYNFNEFKKKLISVKHMLNETNSTKATILQITTVEFH